MTNWRRFEYTNDFDDRMLQLVNTHGKRWRFIATQLGNVISDDAIRNRYMRLSGIAPTPSVGRLEPTPAPRRYRRYWTDEEDEQLACAVQKYGMKWDLIHTLEFPGKTPHALRNRAERMGLKLILLVASTCPDEPVA